MSLDFPGVEDEVPKVVFTYPRCKACGKNLVGLDGGLVHATFLYCPEEQCSMYGVAVVRAIFPRPVMWREPNLSFVEEETRKMWGN